MTDYITVFNPYWKPPITRIDLPGKWSNQAKDRLLKRLPSVEMMNKYPLMSTVIIYSAVWREK